MSDCGIRVLFIFFVIINVSHVVYSHKVASLLLSIKLVLLLRFNDDWLRNEKVLVL